MVSWGGRLVSGGLFSWDRPAATQHPTTQLCTDYKVLVYSEWGEEEGGAGLWLVSQWRRQQSSRWGGNHLSLLRSINGTKCKPGFWQEFADCLWQQKSRPAFLEETCVRSHQLWGPVHYPDCRRRSLGRGLSAGGTTTPGVTRRRRRRRRRTTTTPGVTRQPGCRVSRISTAVAVKYWRQIRGDREGRWRSGILTTVDGWFHRNL